MTYANCIDLVSAPWAITPEAYTAVCAVMNRALSGEAVDLGSVAKQVGRPLQNSKADAQLVGSVAVIPIYGVLARGMNLMMEISGGTSTQVALGQVRDAVANPNVRAIVLRINSPGGSADGTTEIADAVFSARSVKPIAAFAENLMASAAFWIGSSASKVYVSEPTTMVGSIGVVATHVDYSGQDAQLGIRRTDISAGKYKRIDTANAPLSAEGLAYLQDRIDYHYSIFVDAVARNRGAGVDAVLERMADGRVFTGRQAIDAGLVDGIKTFDQVIAELSAAGTSRITASAVPPRGILLGSATPAASSAESEMLAYIAASGIDNVVRQKQMGEPQRIAKAAIAVRDELRQKGLRLSDAEALQLAADIRTGQPENIALHARVHQARERAKGRVVTSSQAVDHVMKVTRSG